MTATQTPTAPVIKGVEVLIPAGELITNDTYVGYMPAPAGLTVTVRSTYRAWDDYYPFSTRYEHIPGTIVWNDEKGGFRSAEVTPAMAEQNPHLSFDGLL